MAYNSEKLICAWICSFSVIKQKQNLIISKRTVLQFSNFFNNCFTSQLLGILIFILYWLLFNFCQHMHLLSENIGALFSAVQFSIWLSLPCWLVNIANGNEFGIYNWYLFPDYYCLQIIWVLVFSTLQNSSVLHGFSCPSPVSRWM